MEEIAILSENDEMLLSGATKILDMWRKRLHIDPLWKIDIQVKNGEDMDGHARIDMFGSEYFISTIELSHYLFSLDKDKFAIKMNEIICHELIHIVSIDFSRTAMLAAAESEAMQEELQYRWEQFTSRLQAAFVTMSKRIEKLKHDNGTLNRVIDEN